MTIYPLTIFISIYKPLYLYISVHPFFYKNHAYSYKNVEGQITPKIKNIVVILLVAISISFPASDEI